MIAMLLFHVIFPPLSMIFRNVGNSKEHDLGPTCTLMDVKRSKRVVRLFVIVIDE